MKSTTALLLTTALALGVVPFATSAARAEMAISVYGGVQGAADSDVTVTGAGAQTFDAGWDGKSFAMPPYYGIRGTWWLENLGQPNLGLSLDFSHAKVYADDATLASSGFSHFEFTDGLNLLTLNALYRMPLEGTKFTPYVGAGVGVNIPHVEVTRGGAETSEFQLGGATLQAQAGVSYQLTKHWAAFAEYKGNYSWIDVDIDSGSKLKTEIFTNAVNLGISYQW